jgi:penicillin-binding protein 1A
VFRLIARFFGFAFATGTILFVLGATVAAGLVYHYQQDLPDYTQLHNY